MKGEWVWYVSDCAQVVQVQSRVSDTSRRIQHSALTAAEVAGGEVAG